jgi:hypothetical protein
MANRSRNESDATSPMHFGMAGNFSADDLQELLGFIPSQVVNNTCHQDHDSSSGSNSNSKSGSGVNHAVHHHYNHVAAITTATQQTSGGDAVVVGGVGSTNVHLHNQFSGGSSSSYAMNTGLLHTTEDDDDEIGGVNARSERKRSREKQRRCDVNKQFSELTEVVKRIELEESQAHLEQQHQALAQQQQQSTGGTETGTGSTPGSGDPSSSAAAAAAAAAAARRMVMPLPSLPAFSPANRVDLMARTIAHLERLHLTTKTQREQIQNLEIQLLVAQKAGEETAQKLKEVQHQQQHQQQIGFAGSGAGMMMVPAQKQQQHQQVRAIAVKVYGWEMVLYSSRCCVFHSLLVIVSDNLSFLFFFLSSQPLSTNV